MRQPKFNINGKSMDKVRSEGGPRWRERMMSLRSLALFFLFRSVPLSDYTVGYGVCVRVCALEMGASFKLRSFV